MHVICVQNAPDTQGHFISPSKFFPWIKTNYSLSDTINLNQKIIFFIIKKTNAHGKKFPTVQEGNNNSNSSIIFFEHLQPEQQASGSQQGATLPPGDSWQSLETFLVVTSAERKCSWHLVGQCQECQHSIMHRPAPHNRELILLRLKSYIWISSSHSLLIYFLYKFMRQMLLL